MNQGKLIVEIGDILFLMVRKEGVIEMSVLIYYFDHEKIEKERKGNFVALK